MFVTPGFRFRVVDRLLTNFHLPKSTLLMLVSAFAGYENIRAAYAHAIAAKYRFFSYGDAMLLERRPPPHARLTPNPDSITQSVAGWRQSSPSLFQVQQNRRTEPSAAHLAWQHATNALLWQQLNS